MVEPAPEVEVVERLRKLLVTPVEAVVDGGDERVRARRERTRRELHTAVREVVDADCASVHPELPIKAHAVDDEPRVVHALLECERAPIHRGAALHERFGHRVEASRHDHSSGRLERRPGGRRDGAPLVEAELPRPVEIKRHDDEQGQSLLQTLLVYLECGQNKTVAAKQLFIHRNTLVYRIGLIEKVAGIDLSSLDADRLFHLMYTCRYLLSRG